FAVARPPLDETYWYWTERTKRTKGLAIAATRSHESSSRSEGTVRAGEFAIAGPKFHGCRRWELESVDRADEFAVARPRLHGTNGHRTERTQWLEGLTVTGPF